MTQYLQYRKCSVLRISQADSDRQVDYTLIFLILCFCISRSLCLSTLCLSSSHCRSFYSCSIVLSSHLLLYLSVFLFFSTLIATPVCQSVSHSTSHSITHFNRDTEKLFTPPQLLFKSTKPAAIFSGPLAIDDDDGDDSGSGGGPDGVT